MKLTLPAAYQPAFAVPAGVLPVVPSAVPSAVALPPSGTGSRTIGAPVALAAALALAGCSAPSSLREYVPQIVTPHRIDIQQGNFVTQDMVDKLQAGQTRDQVRFILGTPLLTDIFHADRWDYVFRSAKGWNDPEKRRLTVFFDKTEKLAKWEAIAVPPPVDLAGGAGTAGANVTAATLPPVESPGLFGRLFGRAAGRTAGSTAASTSGTALPSRTTDADAGATAGGAAAIAAAPSAAAPTAPVAPAPAPPPTSSAAAPAPAAQAPATPALVASPAGAVDGVGNLSLASNTAAATATAAAAVPVAPAASPQSVPVASGAATNEKPGMLGRMFRWMTPSPSVAPAVAAAPAAVPDPVAAAALAPVVAPQPPLPADLAPPVQRAAQAAPAIAAPSALAEPVAATVPAPALPAPPPPPPAAVSATPAPSPVSAAAPAAAISPSLFTDLIEEWRAAWSAKKVEAYIALYAPDFKPPGMTRALWEAQRKERLTKPIFIFVNLSAPQITMSGDNTATAVFTQTYESDTLKQVGRKTLVFGNINGKWLIRDESFKAQ